MIAYTVMKCEICGKEYRSDQRPGDSHVLRYGEERISVVIKSHLEYDTVIGIIEADVCPACVKTAALCLLHHWEDKEITERSPLVTKSSSEKNSTTTDPQDIQKGEPNVMNFPYEMAYVWEPHDWTPISEDELKDCLGETLAQRVEKGETVSGKNVLYRKGASNPPSTSEE